MPIAEQMIKMVEGSLTIRKMFEEEGYSFRNLQKKLMSEPDFFKTILEDT